MGQTLSQPEHCLETPARGPLAGVAPLAAERLRGDAGRAPVPPVQGRRYVIVTPCRDEETHLPACIESIAAQETPPTRWVIVDDGSTDRTPEILAEAARRHPFIRIVRREDRGGRSVGPGVIDAFYAGLDTVNLDEFDYLCKLDADLELPPGYFRRMIERMEADPLLGNFSGKVYLRLESPSGEPTGRLIPETMGDENAIGAAKFYRTACFRDIGGFVRQVAWDGIDGHMCRLRGWIAASEDREEIRIIHRRQMGSSEVGIWTGRQRWGRGKWYMGSAWYYVLAVATFRAMERPWLIGGFGILTGYVRAALTGFPRHGDATFRRHLRRYELQSLMHGKGGALVRANHRIRQQAAARAGVHTIDASRR